MKKLYHLACILIILFCIPGNSYAQEFEWVKGSTYNPEESGYIEPTGMEIDDFGNVYVMGTYDGEMDVNLNNGIEDYTSFGENDLYLIKYDHDGNLIWYKTFDSEPDTFDEYTFPTDILAVGSDYIYITGTFFDWMDFDPSEEDYILSSEAGETAGFAFCLDTAGNFVWAQKYGGFNGDHIRSVAIDGTENLLLTGQITHTIDFDHGPEEHIEIISDSSGYVLSLDLEGNFNWVNVFKGEGKSYLTDLTIKTGDSNEIYATGNFKGEIDADPGIDVTLINTPVDSVESMFIVKLDTDGNFIWVKQVDALNFVQPRNILEHSGNIYISGMAFDSVDFDPGIDTYNLFTGEGYSSFLLKLDSDGNFVWANTVGGTGSIYSTDLMVDNDNTLYVTGFYLFGNIDLDPSDDIFLVDNFEFFLGYNFFIQKFNLDGDFEWGLGSEQRGSEYIAAVGTYGDQLYYYGSCYSSLFDFDLGFGTATVYNDQHFLWKMNYCDAGSSSSITVAFCNAYTVPSGDETYYETGIYYDTLTNISGCDSIITINLEITDETPRIVIESETYIAFPRDAAYQWVDCDNDFESVPGANSQFFVPRVEGNYAAIVTTGECIDTTECINSGPLSLINNEASLQIHIHPNPTKGNINITVTEATNIEIYSAVGELIWQQAIQKGQNKINMNGFAKGLYFITAKSENGVQVSTQKFVLN